MLGLQAKLEREEDEGCEEKERTGWRRRGDRLQTTETRPKNRCGRSTEGPEKNRGTEEIDAADEGRLTRLPKRMEDAGEPKYPIPGRNKPNTKHAKRTPVAPGSQKVYTWEGKEERAQRPDGTKIKKLAIYGMKIAVTGNKIAISGKVTKLQ